MTHNQNQQMPQPGPQRNGLLENLAAILNCGIRVIEGILIFIAVIVGLMVFAFIWPNGWSAWAWHTEFWISILALFFIIGFFMLGKKIHAHWLIGLIVVLFLLTVSRNYSKDDEEYYILKKGTLARVKIPEWENCQHYAGKNRYCIRFQNDTTWYTVGPGLPWVSGGQYTSYFDLKQAENETAAEVIVKVTFTKIPH